MSTLLTPLPEDLPDEPKKLREYIMAVLRDMEFYCKQTSRMEKIQHSQIRRHILPAFEKLLKLEDTIERAQDNLLFKRFGLSFHTLDTKQPRDGDLLIVERSTDDKQAQVELIGGICYELKNHVKVGKWCHASQIKRWRRCETPDAPANHDTVASFAKEALERGRELKGQPISETPSDLIQNATDRRRTT